MRDGNESRQRPNGSYSRYQCPSCGLTRLCVETTEGATRSSISASPQRQSTEQTSAMKGPDLPTASVKLKNPPQENRTHEGVLPAELRHLDGEALDERELRIMQLMYGGTGCPACARLSRGARRHDSDKLGLCRRSRETTSASK